MAAEGKLGPGGYEIHRAGSGQLYQWDMLERSSRCSPWSPLVMYVPLFSYLLVDALYLKRLAPGAVGGLLLGGLAVWTFAEYWLHRTLFHLTGEGDSIQIFHRRIHGIHHEYPNDMTRVVFPPLASAAFATLFYFTAIAALGWEYGPSLFCGFGIGYLWYDMTHWWTHVGKPTTRWGKLIRRHHMTHHFQTPDKRFGVTTPLWDKVFGTLD